MHEIIKKEKWICVRFAIASQTVKVMTTIHGKSLIKTDKALNLYMFMKKHSI
jgi:hypothetical protein